MYTIPGDIKGDERVDTFDMIFMRRAFIETPADERKRLAADMNADGEINVSDAVKLKRFLLGMDI
ncbi:dockerin type I repeat-containing protein [Ruminococcus sp.]|uniref:dockerin type I repeat-containing protein n=1 Tax=Ruminococcus sp. TaxID=41978 RepID=UPI00345685B0